MVVRMQRRLRITAVALLLSLPVVLPTLPTPSGAALVPLGSCYDLLSFDGLDTRGSAFSCADALRTAGYDLSGGFTNKSAKQALARLPADGVFFFGGHSIVAGSPEGAVALLFEFPAPGQSVDALVGDPKWTPLLQGPVELCGNNNQCRNAILVSYPFASQLAKYNLVVFMSSNPAQGNLLVTPMTTVAHLAGAGTVIGFKASPTCPPCKSWASTFWGALKNGATYSSAVVSAAGVGGGFQTWVLLQNPLAPKDLRPPSYYPGTGSLNSAAAPTQIGAADWRSAAVEKWLGHVVMPPTRWLSLERSDGSRYQGQVEGSGLFEVDATTGEVKQAILENELSSPVAAGSISKATANAIATSFAREHFRGFEALSAREAEYVEHGDFREYRFLWQGRAGEAWLPTSVTVGINAASGRVAYYLAQRLPARISSTSRISKEAARLSALRVAAIPGPSQSTDPVLEVVTIGRGMQRLVWATDVSTAPSPVPHVPRFVSVWTDTVTGVSEVVAQG